MPRPKRAPGASQELYEPIAGLDAANGRAGLIGLAGAIDFPRSNAGNPNLWSFGAPDWTVTIPDGDGRAGEATASGNGLGSQSDDHAGNCPAIARSIRSRRRPIKSRSKLEIACASDEEVIRNSWYSTICALSHAR